MLAVRTLSSHGAGQRLDERHRRRHEGEQNDATEQRGTHGGRRRSESSCAVRALQSSCARRTAIQLASTLRRRLMPESLGILHYLPATPLLMPGYSRIH